MPSAPRSRFKRVAQAASERAERLASLLTLSYEPMFAWRLEGPIEFWNAGAERALRVFAG
jgi:PAS domain-containing protein